MNGLRITRPPDTRVPQHAGTAGVGSGATFVEVGTSDFARWFAPLIPLLSRWRWVLHAEPHIYRVPDEWTGPEPRTVDALVLDERDDWMLVEGAWLQAVAPSLLDDWADFFALRHPADRLDGFVESYWSADTPESAHALLADSVLLHFSCMDGSVWEMHTSDAALLDAVRAHISALPGATAAESTLMQSLRRYESDG